MREWFRPQPWIRFIFTQHALEAVGLQFFQMSKIPLTTPRLQRAHWSFMIHLRLPLT